MAGIHALRAFADSLNVTGDGERISKFVEAGLSLQETYLDLIEKWWPRLYPEHTKEAPHLGWYLLLRAAFNQTEEDILWEGETFSPEETVLYSAALVLGAFVEGSCNASELPPELLNIGADCMLIPGYSPETAEAPMDVMPYDVLKGGEGRGNNYYELARVMAYEKLKCFWEDLEHYERVFRLYRGDSALFWSLEPLKRLYEGKVGPYYEWVLFLQSRATSP